MTDVNEYDKVASIRQKELLNGEMKPHRFVEKPMMKNLLPNLNGKKVLLIGCGTGEESTFLEKSGAKEIIGIDISEKSVELANKTYPKHKFIVCDMHKIAFEDNTFDFIYSSLAIHYSKEPKKVYKEIYRVLRNKGQLLYSLAHPIRWASENIMIDGISIRAVGFSNDENNPRLIGKYSTFMEHEHYFPNYGTLKFWVGSPSFHFKLLKETCFDIEDFVESQATEETKKFDSYYYDRYHEFPQFMAFLAKKK